MKDEDVRAEFTRIETLIVAANTETLTRFAVLAESLEDKFKVLADGHIALRDDVGQLREGQQRLEAGQNRLELRQEALEFRQGRLEERQERLEGRQERLEEGQRGIQDRLTIVETGQQSLVTEVRLLSARLERDASRP